jgi:hypothetical protein
MAAAAAVLDDEARRVREITAFCQDDTRAEPVPAVGTRAEPGTLAAD